MILVIILISLAAIFAGWRVTRKSGRKLFFWIIALATAMLVAVVCLSHFNIITAIWFRHIQSIYCLVYLFLIFSTIVEALLGKWKWLRTGLILGLLAIVVYGICNSYSIKTERVELQSDRLPKSFDGFRIALFTDMHLGSIIGQHKMAAQLVEKINALEADMIVFCGDLITYRAEELDNETMSIFAGLKSKYGVWSVIGNHDEGIYHTEDTTIWQTEEALLVEKQLALGWHLLRDETEYITLNGDSIAITGLDYPDELIHRSHYSIENPIDYRPLYLDMERFNITLAHAPQVWEVLCEQDIATDLTLSGHVHSMQMNIFGWTPASLLYKHPSGLYDNGKLRLYVNDGIGSIIVPVRLGVSPEITLITLRR